ncbi:MAG: hypothetical protein NW223_24235 [Hyphomicrobiaceae bacterium]|nr:hypothetical protein [Hyphomicrobiaceae bacterium]
MLFNRVFALVLAVAVMASATVARSADATPNDTARFLAGLPVSPDSPLAPLTKEREWVEHARIFDSIWADQEKRQLSKIREWSAATLTNRRDTLYYFFSGPDFMYADAFFPGAKTYLMAGLELPGRVPDISKLRRGSVASELSRVRTALRTLFSHSYFITSEMGSDLSRTQLSGTLPILYVFLARTGKTIKEASLVSITSDGKLVPSADNEPRGTPKGVQIVFTGPEGKEQSIYYFSTNLANNGVASSGFLKWCETFGTGDGFVKSASYLMHNNEFSAVREFLMKSAARILQDDTGIPLRFLEPSYEVQPYGTYIGPIPVFAGQYQAKMRELFAKGKPPPITFSYGYRYRQSHVLVATRKDVKAEGKR